MLKSRTSDGAASFASRPEPRESIGIRRGTVVSALDRVEEVAAGAVRVRPRGRVAERQEEAAAVRVDPEDGERVPRERSRQLDTADSTERNATQTRARQVERTAADITVRTREVGRIELECNDHPPRRVVRPVVEPAERRRAPRARAGIADGVKRGRPSRHGTPLWPDPPRRATQRPLAMPARAAATRRRQSVSSRYSFRAMPRIIRDAPSPRRPQIKRRPPRRVTASRFDSHGPAIRESR